jgi:hypothetical protein
VPSRRLGARSKPPSRLLKDAITSKDHTLTVELAIHCIPVAR